VVVLWWAPMRAFTLESFETQPALRDNLPEPEFADNGVLVRVHASSVNGADVMIASGLLKEMVEHELPVVLGRDFAGVVERVGTGASRYRIGDEVFGFVLHANPTVHDGSWAELITLPEDFQVARNREAWTSRTRAQRRSQGSARSPPSTRSRPPRERRSWSSGPPEAWAASSSNSPPPRGRG
jgi:threonine dehydrogenase-like Zn-dependent dehydrogenase